MQAMLEHTVGKPPGMKRVSSERQMMGPSSLTSSPVAGLRPLRVGHTLVLPVLLLAAESVCVCTGVPGGLVGDAAALWLVRWCPYHP